MNATTTTAAHDKIASLLDRWAADPKPFTVVRAWEILPAPSGQLHAVDPDPDARVDNYPVSLCGRMLIAKGGKTDDSSVCDLCLEISREREQEASE